MIQSSDTMRTDDSPKSKKHKKGSSGHKKKHKKEKKSGLPKDDDLGFEVVVHDEDDMNTDDFGGEDENKSSMLKWLIIGGITLIVLIVGGIAAYSMMSPETPTASPTPVETTPQPKTKKLKVVKKLTPEEVFEKEKKGEVLPDEDEKSESKKEGDEKKTETDTQPPKVEVKPETPSNLLKTWNSVSDAFMGIVRKFRPEPDRSADLEVFREVAISGDHQALSKYFTGLKEAPKPFEKFFNLILGQYENGTWSKNTAGVWSNLFSFWKNWKWQKRGNVLFHYAIMNGHVDLVKYLYKYYSSYSMPINSKGQTTLHLAIQCATRLPNGTPIEEVKKRWRIIAILLGQDSWYIKYTGGFYSAAKGVLKNLGSMATSWLSQGKKVTKTTAAIGGALNSGSNGDLVATAKHLGAGGKEVMGMVQDFCLTLKEAYMLEDEARVDIDGNNAFHYLFLPLLENKNEALTDEYCNVVAYIVRDSGAGCEPERKNNAGKTPIDLLKELQGVRKDNEEQERLKLMLGKLEGYVTTQNIKRKAKGIGGGVFYAGVASMVATPLIAARTVWWFARWPASAIEGVLGINSTFLSMGITFSLLCLALNLLKNKIRKLFGFNYSADT